MDKSVSVQDYCRTFCEKVVKGQYGETLEDNRRLAGQQFVSLVIKIQEAGSKDDIKVPLRVLRDEIGRAFFSGIGHKKAEHIESLFQLYDALESSCQDTLKAGRTGDQKENATAAQLLEELRIRFVRLAVGETWEKFPELKFLALKRMYKYMVKEQEALRMKGKLALGGASSGSGRFNAKFMRTLSLQPSGSSGATWQAALEDLVKAPSNKLFPFVKLLLAENSLLQGSAEAPDANDTQAGDSGVNPLKDAGAVGRATSDFSLDDLLGLGPDPAPSEINEPPTPSSDPFQPSPSRSNSQPPPPHTTHVPAFETSFPEHPQERQPPPAQLTQQAQQPQQPPAQPAGGSNPFGASAFGAKAFPGPPEQPPARTASSGAFALPATPAPSLATGASSEAPGFPQTLPTAGLPSSRTSSGAPPSPMHRPPSVGRRTTSSEVEVPAPMPAPVPVPAGASSEGSEDHAFETSFPPAPENTQSFAGPAGSPNPSPFLKAPPAPVRQLSSGPGMARGLSGSGSMGMGSGQLSIAGSSTFSPPLRTNSSGMQPSANEGHLVRATSDATSGSMMPSQPQTQAPAAAPVAPPVPVRSPRAAGMLNGIPAGQPTLQRAGPGSGSTNSRSQSFTPKIATGFEDSAFPGSPGSAGVADASAQGNCAKGASGAAFNPFGLPSSSFASPVPVTADNRFADVSPMADAPQPSFPAPMRAPPAPPSGGPASKVFSAW